MTLSIIVRPGQATPQEGAEVIFKDGSRFLFGGYISKITPQEVGKGQLFNYKVEVSDYSYIFNSKIARRAYQNETLGAIVADLMTTYVSSYGFDLSNVAEGPTIPSVTFDHISIRACFEKLQKLTGYNWFADYQKRLYFQTSTASPAPEAITDESDNFQDISISYDISQVRNSVIVIGSDLGEAANTPTVQHFTADGLTRIWPLDDKPVSISYVKINGVSQQIHQQTEEQEGDEVLYNPDDVYFWLNTAVDTPANGVDIEVGYFPRIDIIVQRTDPASIARFAAQDGGNGIKEYTIKEPSIASKAEAAARAAQELEQYSMPLVTGLFTTRTSLLANGSIFAPGQYVVVNLPTYGIDADTAFLIQQVDITAQEDGERTEYAYTVRFGGKIVSVQGLLEGLASKTEEVQDATKILTIQQLTETAEIEDEAPTHAIFTPPFQYGPGGSPQGRYNLSEWS
jgi:hypothetical protein